MIIVYILVTFFIIDALHRVLPTKRKRTIEQILSDLHKLDRSKNSSFAIDENIKFFNAIRGPITFLYWQLTSSKINKVELLELADFGIIRWEDQLYKDLGALERKKIPGLLNLLIKYLSKNNRRTYIDVGCGHMEVFRQIVDLNKRREAKIMVGVDMSDAAFGRIKKNFSSFEKFVDIKQVRPSDLSKILKNKYKKHQILFVKGDALRVLSALNIKFDIVLSSRVKHHIHDKYKKSFDETLRGLGKKVLEFDDLRSPFSWIAPTLTVWMKPVSLNGALLSRLRQPTKKQMQGKGKLITGSPGVYLLELN